MSFKEVSGSFRGIQRRRLYRLSDELQAIFRYNSETLQGVSGCLKRLNRRTSRDFLKDFRDVLGHLGGFIGILWRFRRLSRLSGISQAISGGVSKPFQGVSGGP